jgi:hypothetical protein
VCFLVNNEALVSETTRDSIPQQRLICVYLNLFLCRIGGCEEGCKCQSQQESVGDVL